MKEAAIYIIAMISFNVIGLSPGIGQENLWAKENVDSISFPGRWSAALNSAMSDFRKEFGDKVNCYRIEIYQNSDVLMIGFSSIDSDNSQNTRGSSGPCGPDFIYSVKLNGVIISRSIVQ